MGSVNPSLTAVWWICSTPALLPTYREARSSGVAPPRRGTRKKIENTTALTTKSRITAPIRRRMMYVNTVVGLVGGGHAAELRDPHRPMPSPTFGGRAGRPLFLGRSQCCVVVLAEAVV